VAAHCFGEIRGFPRDFQFLVMSSVLPDISVKWLSGYGINFSLAELEETSFRLEAYPLTGKKTKH
jgi:hypothetical protein